MKSILFHLSVGLLALITFQGCGRNQQTQDEVVREFEESFALDTAQDRASGQSSTPDSEWSGGTASRQPGSTADASSGPGASQAAAGSPADQGASASMQEISPAIRGAAQEVVQFMNTGQYSSAVASLDRLLGEPELTPDQWIAARNAMAEVQRRIIMDPAISEAEKERARDVLRRQ